MVTPATRKAIYEEGFTIIPSVVPAKQRDDALRIINKALAEGMSKEAAEKVKNGVQFEHLQSHAAITSLINQTPAKKLICDLIGDFEGVYGGQVALRFPGHSCLDADGRCPTPYWQHHRNWHIDGLPGHLPSHLPGTIHNFSALVGVVLQDVPEEHCGNLIVYPGSHWLLQDHFRAGGLPAVEEKGDPGLPRSLPFAESVQVRARAGDLVIAHYQLAHAIAPNSSPNIRYVIYFRVRPASCPRGYHREAMTNIWIDWPAMHPFITAHPYEPSLRPSYKDDCEVASLLVEADRAFTAHEHGTAGPLFERLSALRPRNYIFAHHGGIALLYDSARTPASLERAAILCQRASAIAPYLVTPHCQLARARQWQGRLAEAEQVVRAALIEDNELVATKEHIDALMEGVRVVREVLDATGRGAQYGAAHARILGRFPFLAEKLGEDSARVELQQLWREALSLVTKPTKLSSDWLRARAVFKEIVKRDPKSYMGLLGCGIACAYDPSVGLDIVLEGLRLAQQAIELDPASPLAYALLARLTVRRDGLTQVFTAESKSAVLAATDIVVSFAPSLTKRDHDWLLLDALRCAMTASDPGDRPAYVVRFKNAYPHLAAQADGVAREGCVIS
eukprot:m.100024 g.100024  ORF g.100024 m.100024 type:complete len:620 (+) comp14047_c0_seq8:66-1925(+)